MNPLDPAPNLTEQVYARILEAIIDRSLLPGQRITQNEMAERLGVSRQPVSLALHHLFRQGLLAESDGREVEALAFYDKVLAADANNVEANAQSGRLLEKRSKHADAVKRLAKARYRRDCSAKCSR